MIGELVASEGDSCFIQAVFHGGALPFQLVKWLTTIKLINC